MARVMGRVSAKFVQVRHAPWHHRIARPMSTSIASSHDVPSLEGEVAWVIGGVGLIGTGICRGLLRAGATVVVNSRYRNRLEQLASELDHPEGLVTIEGTMIGDEADATVRAGMSLTDGRLHHARTPGTRSLETRTRTAACC